jgi:hypothetical protein
MNQDPDSEAPPKGWIDSLLRAKAQIAAGQTVPVAPVLGRLRASAERMEARRGKAAKKA